MSNPWAPPPDGSRRGLAIGFIAAVAAVALLAAVFTHPEWREQHTPDPKPGVSTPPPPRPRR